MQLSGKAERLLKVAAASSEASIIVEIVQAMECVSVDNKNLIRRQTPKDIAGWKEALEELEREGFVRVSDDGWIHSVTGNGFTAADKL